MNSAAKTQDTSDMARDHQGAPSRDSSVSDDIDARADELIRQVMIEQKREDSHNALPPLSKPTEPSAPKPSKQKAAVKHPRRSASNPSPVIDRVAKAVDGDDSTRPPSFLSNGIAAIKSYRPTRKHIIIAALCVVMLLRPWLIPVTLFVLFLTVLIAYLTLGPDRVAELVVHGWQRLNMRNPELAEALRQRAETTALRIDAFLDRVPGTWTDNLHVPDFSKPDPEVRNRPDPFDRLAKEAQRG